MLSTNQTMVTQAGADRILRRFGCLSRLLIDASSIIYMIKAGYFDCLSENLELYSPLRILEETGYRGLRVHPLAGANRGSSADETLVESAVLLGYPVVTDDRGIMRQLAKREIPFFNAQLMLEFLFYNELIGEDQRRYHLRRLLLSAWYGPQIVQFGEVLHQRLIQVRSFPSCPSADTRPAAGNPSNPHS